MNVEQKQESFKLAQRKRRLEINREMLLKYPLPSWNAQEIHSRIDTISSEIEDIENALNVIYLNNLENDIEGAKAEFIQIKKFRIDLSFIREYHYSTNGLGALEIITKQSRMSIPMSLTEGEKIIAQLDKVKKPFKAV